MNLKIELEKYQKSKNSKKKQSSRESRPNLAADTQHLNNKN